MSITAYICVADARAAIEWYVTTLGATVTFEPIIMDDGRVGHVELGIGEGRFMMSDQFDSAGVAAPDPSRGNAVSLHLNTPDVDGLAQRAVEAGATLDREPASTPHGRIAVFHDPFGHRWMLNDEA
jgi:PhnB protein